jgi:hypothetical protein
VSGLRSSAQGHAVIEGDARLLERLAVTVAGLGFPWHRIYSGTRTATGRDRGQG